MTNTSGEAVVWHVSVRAYAAFNGVTLTYDVQ
jgi:hypothetical protein